MVGNFVAVFGLRVYLGQFSVTQSKYCGIEVRLFWHFKLILFLWPAASLHAHVSVATCFLVVDNL